jgi:hypothetical protein
MPSTDPWYDWIVTFGLPDGWPCPSELAHLLPNGAANAWARDQDGNVIVPYLFPPFPAGAPLCAIQWREQVTNLLVAGYQQAIASCGNVPLAFRFEFIPGYRLPDGFNFASLLPSGEPYWNDPCFSDYLRYPRNCPWLDDFLSGFNTANCPEDYIPNTFFRPGAHRVISEIIRPTGMPFLWRLEYDLTLWPTVFDLEILAAGNACSAYAGALLLQLEALQELLNSAGSQTGRAIIQFTQGFDGVFTDARYKVFTEDSTLVGEGIIGWNRIVEIGFCPDNLDGVFRTDIGRRPCEDYGDDDMGCSCDEVRSIVREELETVTNSYLNPIKNETDFLGGLFRALENRLRAFFGSGDTSWDTFLSRFSLLSGFLRPSNTDPDTVISPPLPDRIKDEFEINRKRLVQIYASVQRRIKVRVDIQIEGEKLSSRDTFLHGPRSSERRPYNHFGQLWLKVRTSNSGIEKIYPWVWIRSRTQTFLFEIWDERVSERDILVITPEYQLFEGLRVTRVTTLAEVPRFSDINLDPIWQAPVGDD